MHLHTILVQFMGKGILIDFFQKTASEPITDRKSTTNNLFRYLLDSRIKDWGLYFFCAG